MTFWLILAALAQVLNAGTVLIDKYVLVNVRGEHRAPVSYAFYISLLSGFVLVLVPFGYIGVPSAQVLFLCLLTAATYIASIVFLYTALRSAGPSDVVPVVGALSAIATFLLAYIYLRADLPESSGLAFGLLILGTFLISRFRFTWKGFCHVALAGILFGVSAFLIKLIFLSTTFIDGFFWSRMTNVIGALILLAWPGNYQAIFASVKHSTSRTKLLVVGNKALSGAAFVLTLFAIHLGSVSVVNALSGLQFVFLFLFALIGAHRYPKIFHGEIPAVRTQSFPHKVYGIIFIVFGLLALFLL